MACQWSVVTASRCVINREAEEQPGQMPGQMQGQMPGQMQGQRRCTGVAGKLCSVKQHFHCTTDVPVTLL